MRKQAFRKKHGIPTQLDDLPGIADRARQGAEQVETTLTTIHDRPIDIAWLTLFRRVLAGFKKAMTGVREESANNLTKLSSIDDGKTEVEQHLALDIEHRRKQMTPKYRVRFET